MECRISFVCVSENPLTTLTETFIILSKFTYKDNIYKMTSFIVKLDVISGFT